MNTLNEQTPDKLEQTPQTTLAIARARAEWKSTKVKFPVQHFNIAKELELALIKAQRRHRSDLEVIARQDKDFDAMQAEIGQLRFELLKLKAGQK